MDNNSNKIEVLSVSNLKEAKGIQFNIKAVGVLIEKYPNIQYNIVGDGEYKEELDKLIKELALEENIKFLGKLPYDEVIENMRKCDIFSLPSYKEGFGMVYIEAMAQGKPVIGIKGEGIADVIDNGVNGFLVQGKNIEELTETLDYLICNEEKRKEIGHNAKNEVINNYTWDMNAEKLINTYKSLIK